LKAQKVVGFDLVALAVDRARRAEWPGIREILKDAIEKIDNGQLIHEGRRDFLADALEKLNFPEDRVILAEAVDRLRTGDHLRQEVAVLVCNLLRDILTKMSEAMKLQGDEISEKPTMDCNKLFAPNPPAHKFLALDPQIAIAFRLKKPPSRGGKPRHAPTDQLFAVYNELRGYGLGKTQAQAVLADRFKAATRTIQRKLEQETVSSLEFCEGEPVLVRHEPGEPKPKNRPGAGYIPYEPYLKARLTIATWNYMKDGARPLDAYKQVATKFGLAIEGTLFGPKVVEKAVKLCERHRSCWAKVPLEVCQQESDRPPNIWPTAKDVTDVRSLAARMGESPATIDAVSRDLWRSWPKHQAVQATAEKLGLTHGLVHAMCRERVELEHES
jgi:hypothetical protein